MCINWVLHHKKFFIKNRAKATHNKDLSIYIEIFLLSRRAMGYLILSIVDKKNTGKMEERNRKKRVVNIDHVCEEWLEWGAFASKDQQGRKLVQRKLLLAFSNLENALIAVRPMHKAECTEQRSCSLAIFFRMLSNKDEGIDQQSLQRKRLSCNRLRIRWWRIE